MVEIDLMNPEDPPFLTSRTGTIMEDPFPELGPERTFFHQMSIWSQTNIPTLLFLYDLQDQII